MGRYLKQYEKENMRMAMLKQEETFRHQVHELHRLYRVQKVLVNDMKQRKPSNSGTNKLERWNIDSEITTSQQRRCYSSSPALNLDLPAAEEYIGKDDDDGDHVVMLGADEDSTELELTLAIGSSKSTRKKERYSSTATSDSGASFSSSSSSSISDYYYSASAEAAKMKKLNGNEYRGAFQVPADNINLGNYQKERKKGGGFNVEEHMTREERVMSQPPPWLFHCLSLNMT